MIELPGGKVVFCTPRTKVKLALLVKKKAQHRTLMIVTCLTVRLEEEPKNKRRERVIVQKLHISMSPGSRLCLAGITQRNSDNEDNSCWYGVAQNVNYFPSFLDEISSAF